MVWTIKRTFVSDICVKENSIEQYWKPNGCLQKELLSVELTSNEATVRQLLDGLTLRYLKQEAGSCTGTV